MEELSKNLYLLRSLRDFVESKNTLYYSHTIVNEKELSENTISIVMTAHERSRQVYFTLDTISRCSFKDIQVIIVDDSINDKITTEGLSRFNIHIELISINRSLKYWVNPCINYNIGFKYIRGGKVVIQNGEVCYVGDLLEYINNNVIKDNYYVFDVKASRDFNKNEVIYNRYNLTPDIYNEDLWLIWYQHSIERNRYFHFLAATTRDTFNKIGDFSYDYSFGSSYDDNDFVLKINHNNINLINVSNNISNIGGIHLYHGYTVNIAKSDAYTKQQNEDLFNKKRNYINTTNSYLELSDNTDYNILQNEFNRLDTY